MDNRKSKFITKKIKVYGIVQGVGFRPLVYRIAKKLGVTGTVRNVGGYVEIVVQTSGETFEVFIDELMGLQSTGVEIIKLEIEDSNPFDHQQLDAPNGNTSVGNYHQYNTHNWKDFVIINSGVSEEVSILPPDLPVCPVCQEELHNLEDRRYHNPFISCMSCGPRYTIMEEVPYDRETTTMVDYTMCHSCHQEYVSPASRRFHAQTISCNECGPYLIFQDNTILLKTENVKNNEKDSNSEIQITDEDNNCDHRLKNETALSKAITMIKEGKIIAVKGIGGFHMVCSPYKEETVQNLRKLKGREEKPFAVMFPDLQELEYYCKVSKEERALLSSNARPIVLLSMHQDTMAPSTNKGSLYCGAFLPYTPLQILLTKECGPLIMTSANLSNQPIIKDDEVMCSLSSPYLSGVLYNKRRIVRTVDDSVAKVIDGKPQLIRRSRGFVPYPVFLPAEDKDEYKAEQVIFATGGDLKAAFCFYKNGSVVVSQYFGDLEEETVMKEYRTSYTDLARLLKIQPTLAVCDYHPNYYSTHYAKELGLPLLQVQHHHAHIASVMAEHDLHEKVIGIAFDGTGYGMDGNIWGGEFLLCEGAHFIRAAQLAYTPMIGGDQSMKDARKTASCYLLQAGLDAYVRDDRKNVIKSALEHKINTILTSSMGRLFDAVSSILEIAHENTYEGECAALLEKEAVLAKRNLVEPAQLVFAISKKNEIIKLEPASVLEELCNLRDKKSVGALALGFHYALASAVADICMELREKYQTNVVALSGGVFQNTVLTEQTLSILREKEFQVYMNMAVPPNDGAISLGQVFIGKEYERLDEYVRCSTR